MKSPFLAAAFIAVVTGICGTSLAPAQDFAAIDSVFQRELRRGHIPGAALVIVKADRIVHVRGFGIADPSGRAVTPQTPFYLGSTTKSITAMALLQLVEEGRIELDAPVQRYLPWFTLADSAVSRTITVRDLLVHRGKIPARYSERFLAEDDTASTSAEEHLRWLADKKPVEGFQYNNLGFDALGLIVEAASGQPYAEYLRRRVFIPLGMRHTWTERRDAMRDGLAAGYAIALGRAIPYRMPANRGALASGYLMASAEDIGRYLIAHTNKGVVPGQAGISRAVIESMHVSRGAIVPGRDITFGFTRGQLDDVDVLDISGSVPTYASRFIVVPDSGWGVGVLVNANAGIPEIYVQGGAENVVRMAMGKAPTPVQVPFILRVIVAVALSLPVMQLLFVARTYRRVRSGKRVWFWGPAIADLSWGLFVFWGFPALLGSYWPTMVVFQPELCWPLIASGVISLLSCVTRAALIKNAQRRASA